MTTISSYKSTYAKIYHHYCKFHVLHKRSLDRIRELFHLSAYHPNWGDTPVDKHENWRHDIGILAQCRNFVDNPHVCRLEEWIYLQQASIFRGNRYIRSEEELNYGKRTQINHHYKAFIPLHKIRSYQLTWSTLIFHVVNVRPSFSKTFWSSSSRLTAQLAETFSIIVGDGSEGQGSYVFLHIYIDHE